MPKIVTVEQMRAIEQAADAAGHSYAAMMAHAGQAVADRVLDHAYGVQDPRILVIVGPGNNGGDGLVAGRLLAAALDDAQVTAYLLKPRDADEDAVFAGAVEAGVTVITAGDDKKFKRLRELVAEADVLIDALFGTSLRLPIKGTAANLLQAVNEALAARRAERPRATYTTPAIPPAPDARGPLVVAVDAPSGVDCDSGEMDANTIPAHATVTFAAAKPGLLAFPGAGAVGTLHIGDIGLPPLPELDDIALELLDAPATAVLLPDRPPDSYKGTFGKVMIVAGSSNYVGAAYMTAAAAYRAGAGWVTVAAPQVIVPTLAGMLPEATWILLPHEMGVINEHAVRVLREEDTGYSALLVGPGVGQEESSGEFLRELLRPEEELRHSRALGFVPMGPENAGRARAAAVSLPPLVIDASGLYLLAQMDDWPALLPEGTILTPHPGEFARLAGMTTGEVQADRVKLAQAKAAEWRCVVVLKGAFTVIAAPDGRTAVLPFATAALASAGTGDVLAGAITGLLAQGLEPYAAAAAGAYLHGLAGLRAGELFGVASTTAGDVLELLPDAYDAVAALRG